MSAKTQATQDIKQYLSTEARSFIMFRRDLDPIMNQLVNDYIKQQNSL